MREKSIGALFCVPALYLALLHYCQSFSVRLANQRLFTFLFVVLSLLQPKNGHKKAKKSVDTVQNDFLPRIYLRVLKNNLKHDTIEMSKLE